MKIQPDQNAVNRGRLTCGAIFIALLWGWLVVLPTIGRIRPVSQWIESTRAAGVDPSAMFYTEVFDTVP